MDSSAERESSTKLLSEIGEILERAKDKATDTLKPYTQRGLEQDEIYACFELMNMQNYSLNYNKFFAKIDDQGRTKLETDWAAIDENYASFIPELEKCVEDYFQNHELSEVEGSEFNVKHEAQLFKWFSECWESAGGERTLVPTFFCFDKEYACRDMKTGAVMSEVEAAKRLGHEVEV